MFTEDRRAAGTLIASVASLARRPPHTACRHRGYECRQSRPSQLYLLRALRHVAGLKAWLPWATQGRKNAGMQLAAIHCPAVQASGKTVQLQALQAEGVAGARVEASDGSGM